MIEAIKAQQKRAIQTDNDINKTLKGVLINNHVKNDTNSSFNQIKDELLVYSSNTIPAQEKENKNTTKNEDSCFNAKKALIPVIAGTGAVIAGCAGISTVLKKSSQNILKTKAFEQLPDLAVNMNIKEETQFAIYRAVRDPNYKNVIGAAAVFIMSAITLAAKSFIDGTKQVWLKKKSADIEKNLQENLIEVETNSFSGKLNVVNDLMNKNIKHFDEFLKKTEGNKETTTNLIDKFTSFKGETQETQELKKDNEFTKNLKYIALVTGIAIGAVLLGKYSLNNIRKTAQNTSDFANNIAEKTIDAINDISKKGDKKDVPAVTELLKSICAKPEYVEEVGGKFSLSKEEIDGIKSAVEETKKTIFSDAPTALGGIPKKVQYYCYIDENRGHLYNWIINPENKFTKYLFEAFTLSSAIAYTFQQGMDAIKEYAVMKENAKTELNLRKRLVDVEINNFKAKKESAINPLVENFDKAVKNKEKSPEELKQLADNILSETKNGPPYVYT